MFVALRGETGFNKHIKTHILLHYNHKLYYMWTKFSKLLLLTCESPLSADLNINTVLVIFGLTD